MKLNEYMCIGGLHHGEILSGMVFTWAYRPYNKSISIVNWFYSAANLKWLHSRGYCFEDEAK